MKGKFETEEFLHCVEAEKLWVRSEGASIPEDLAQRRIAGDTAFPNEEMLTPEQLARNLNVDKSWVYSQTRRKGPDAIPVVRVGKYCRFIKSEVIEWLRARQHHRKN